MYLPTDQLYQNHAKQSKKKKKIKATEISRRKHHQLNHSKTIIQPRIWTQNEHFSNKLNRKSLWIQKNDPPVWFITRNQESSSIAFLAVFSDIAFKTQSLQKQPKCCLTERNRIYLRKWDNVETVSVSVSYGIKAPEIRESRTNLNSSESRWDTLGGIDDGLVWCRKMYCKLTSLQQT